MFVVYILIFIFTLLLSYNFILGNVVEGMKTKKNKVDKIITKTVNKEIKKQKKQDDITLLNTKVDKLTKDFKEINDKVDKLMNTLDEDTDITPEIMSGVIETFTPF